MRSQDGAGGVTHHRGAVTDGFFLSPAKSNWTDFLCICSTGHQVWTFELPKRTRNTSLHPWQWRNRARRETLHVSVTAPPRGTYWRPAGHLLTRLWKRNMAWGMYLVASSPPLSFYFYWLDTTEASFQWKVLRIRPKTMVVQILISFTQKSWLSSKLRLTREEKPRTFP